MRVPDQVQPPTTDMRLEAPGTALDEEWLMDLFELVDS